jgi:transposase InsO family protein
LPQRIAEIERLRRQRMSGLAIARELRMPRATVGAVLRRLGLGKLAALQPREPVIRYERERPGELLHLDIKSLGKIDGVGHRITGDRTAQSRKRGIGWDHLHVAIDDASRLAYTEVLPSLTGEDAAAFLQRALAWYARLGVRVERVMTDNGSAYVSRRFAQALNDARTRPSGRAPTARRSASYRQPCANGPTPGPTSHPTSAPPPSAPGPTPTTSSAHTPASETSAPGKG